MLARPEKRNAQDKRMLYELNDAFDRACQDDGIKVIILGADGPDFSSGHDVSPGSFAGPFPPVSCWGGASASEAFNAPDMEGVMAFEEETFLNMCWRWRNIPKPTIAQVQGRVIAGGLMLMWPCDLIVASQDATFSDPVLAFGLNGHEFFAHVWELGARKAKELLFTGAALGAEQAQAIGMVNRVVPLDELQATTLDLARTIATRPMMALKLAKLSCNQSLEAQGLWTAIQAAYSLHALGHSHNLQLHGVPFDPAGIHIVRDLTAGTARDRTR
jgi:enoyl-CoA hydratase